MSTQTAMTAADLLEMGGRLGPCELVRGEVVSLSPSGPSHSRITSKINARLERWAEESGLGRTMSGEVGLIVERDPDTVRGADAVYYSYQRLGPGDLPPGFFSVPPNLVVEIVSQRQSWREAVRKSAEYLGWGVDLVWIIDSKSQRVHVYRPDAAPVILNCDELLSDDVVLPGFQCVVREVVAD